MSMRMGLAALAVTASLVQLGGCATGATSNAMVYDKATVPRAIGDTVAVSVSGGKETSSMGASQISSDSFAEALRDSLTKSGLFKQVIDGGRYKLTAFIGKVDQPLFGLSFTVKMEVSYTLVDTQSGKSVWTQNIASEHTTKAGESFAAVKRLRLANEGAAKANIEQAVAAMSALAL